MSPSRPFILRPVATTLLMAAILLVGAVAYRFLPISALPEVDYPTIQVQTFYPRRQPRGDDLLDHLAAGGAVRADAQPEPDVLHQFGRIVADHPAVQPRRQPRRGGAGGPGAINAAGNLLPSDLPAPPIYAQGQPGRCADPDPGADLEDAAADPGPGHGKHPPGTEDLPAARRRPGQHQRRPAPRRAHPDQPARARRLRAEHRRPAHHPRQRQRQHPEGQLRRPPTRPRPSTPTTRSPTPASTSTW